MEQKFENSVETIEKKESLPIRETVRAALFYRGEFLILQKNAASKNPGALEFPGGKIDEIKGETSTLEEQEQAVREEVKQETGINIADLSMEKVEDFGTYFETINKDGVKNKNKRRIHLFLIRIPDSYELSIKVNETKNEKGESEDKHENYIWVSPDELIDSAVLLKENPHTGKRTRRLSRNSSAIKKLFKKAGVLKEITEVTPQEALIGLENKK